MLKHIKNLFFKKSSGKPEMLIPFIQKSGDYIEQLSDGENLVDNKQAWEHAKTGKQDLSLIKKCCDAEIRTMNKATLVPAPYYFERVAILLRKQKDYKQEIYYCDFYIQVVEEFYKKRSSKRSADVRKGPRYKAIKHRLIKAKKLLKKQSEL